MPINPTDQQRAMFTVQRGPKRTSNDMSVSLDASSIEPAEPLDEITNPEEKEEARARQTKIIALLGLDTISTAIGFEDFSNYFTMRSIESSLCQSIIEEHLEDFDPASRGDKLNFSLAAVCARFQRAGSNSLRKIHSILGRTAEGIESTGNNSAFDLEAWRLVSSANIDLDDQNTSGYKFRNTEKARIGVPRSFEDRIEKFLGLRNFRDQRPTFQYLKLAMDMNAMLLPRTCPTFYDSNVERAIGTFSGQAMLGYDKAVIGWNGEGIPRASAEGFRELRLEHLQRKIRIGPARYDHALAGIDSEGNQRLFAHLNGQQYSKNISSFIYLIQRDIEMTTRMSSRPNRIEMIKKVSVPNLQDLSMSDAFGSAKRSSAEGDDNVLEGMVGPPRAYEVEDRDSTLRTRWFRVCSLESLGLTQSSRRGRNSNSPVWTSPGQLYQKVHGTPGSLEALGNLSEEQHERAKKALEAVKNHGNVGHKFANFDMYDIMYYVGDFLEKLSPYASRMFRNAERLNPGHFAALKRQGEDTGDGGSAHFDLNRWKAYGLDGASLSWGNRDDLGRGNEFLERQWSLQSADQTKQALEGDFNANIDYLREQYPTGSGARYLNQIEEMWRSFSDKINETDVYNAASKGVVNLNSEDSPGMSFQFAQNRVSMGLALVLSAMKHRNNKDAGKFEFYNRLYSRFRFAIFTRLTGDSAGLTSADPALAFSGGSRATFENRTGGLIGDQIDIPMAFRDVQINPEGSPSFNVPLTMYSNNIKLRNVNTISEIIEGNLPPYQKASFFGYIKTKSGNGSKFRIPTESAVRFDYSDSFQEMSTASRGFLENDIGKICDTLADLGIVSSALSSQEEGQYFAVNMAAGQAEEYYEIGWALIGDVVANSISEMLEIFNLTSLLNNGLTRVAAQGLDTYITLFFEILGMVADATPVSVANAQDFYNTSPDKSESVLLEDIDLRNAVNEQMFDQGGGFNDRSQNLFFSKSGVDTNVHNEGADWELKDEIARMYRHVAAAARRNSTSDERIHFDGVHQGGVDPDGNVIAHRGTFRYNLKSRSTINWLRKTINEQNKVDNQANQAVTTDISIIFPKHLKGVIAGVPSSPFIGFSSTAWLKQLGRYFKSGECIAQSQYEKNPEYGRHNLVEGYSRIADTATSSGVDVQDSYLRACDEYYSLLNPGPREGSIFDIYKIAENLVYNDLARETASSSLEAFNSLVMSRTKGVEEKVNNLMQEISSQEVIFYPLIAEKVQRNINYFDSITSDRPLRTVAKLLPRGVATSPMTPFDNALQPGEDYDPGAMLRLSSYSEFTNTTKNLILAYLEHYPIEDIRETIIAAGCPAGSDTKNLGKYQGRSFGIRTTGASQIAPSRDPYADSITRIFQITGERDLQSTSEGTSQFTINRKYQIKYFLLPESFEGITDEDTFDVSDPLGWIRAISKRVKWFKAPSGLLIGEDYMDSLVEDSWSRITRQEGMYQELDDMVESFILQWLVAFVSGVMIDQDLIFRETDGASSIDIVAPGTSQLALLRRKEEESDRAPILGYPIEGLDLLTKPNAIPSRHTGVNSRNPNYLGAFAGDFRAGIVTDAAAKNLVIDDYRTELDEVTGAEIRVPVEATIKPWNIRLTASLFNSYMYKAPIVTSIMTSRPAFDYIMFFRLKSSDFESSGTSPVDILSYRVSITNGRPQTAAEGG